MIPVLEETVLTRRWTEGTYGLDSIRAYSAVCAGGVDTVPLPGDTSEADITRIVGDVATLAFKWNKPLAARLLPAPGKNAGEMTEFSGALANAIIQPLPGAKRSAPARRAGARCEERSGAKGSARATSRPASAKATAAHRSASGEG